MKTIFCWVLLFFVLLVFSFWVQAAWAHDGETPVSPPECICPVDGECSCPFPTPEWKHCHDTYWFYRDGTTNPQNLADLRDALRGCDAGVRETNLQLGCAAYPQVGIDHSYAVGAHALGLIYRFPQHPIESRPLDVAYCESHIAAAIATINSYLILNDLCYKKLALRRWQLGQKLRNKKFKVNCNW